MLANENQHQTMRSEALKQLGHNTDPRAITAISTIIRSERKHEWLRIEAIYAVGREHNNAPEVIDALIHNLRDATAKIKRLSADALGDMGDASAIQALLTALKSEEIDTKARSAVVSALGKFHVIPAHSALVMEILIDVLESTDYEISIRTNAAFNLGNFINYLSIYTLETIAKSPDETQELRLAAIDALARIANEAGAYRPGLQSDNYLQPSGSYILTPAMHRPDWDEVKVRWNKYRHYLESISDLLPPNAKAFALSEIHNGGSRECPHDSRLEQVRVEVQTGREHPIYSEYTALDIHARFLGSYDDGYIEFHYRNVHNYVLTEVGDWMYDEVRLGPENHVIHEIRFLADSHWLIECDDFTYQWLPIDKDASPKE